LAVYPPPSPPPAPLATRAGSRAAAVAAVHLAALALAIYAARASGSVLPMAFPLVAFPLLYAEMPLLIGGVNGVYHDAIVQRWELSLFGGTSPAQTMAGATTHALGPLTATLLSEIVHASYFFYYLIIYLPPIILLARGERVVFGRTL